MAYDVGEVQFDCSESCLHEVLMMVRTGLFRKSPEANVQPLIWKAINQLKAESKRNPQFLNEVQKLRLVTVEAEAYHENGMFPEATRTLQPIWNELEPRLTAWTEERHLETSKTPLRSALLRQKVWALLDYAFFRYCRVEGRQTEAIRYFRTLEKVISKELATPSYTPHGTFALCHYYMGVCNNVLSASEAENHLLEAQKHSYQRAARQLSVPGMSDEDRDYEEAYKNIFGGRILSGLARLAMQEGHLARAEHILYAIQNQHLGTKKAIVRFISMLLWTVKRRRAHYGDAEYEIAMDGLIQCYKPYLDARDAAGQLRCSTELAQGYLDWAEFGDGVMRRARLKNAELWLHKASAAATLATLSLRKDLLEVRLHILKGNILKANNRISDVRVLAKGDILHECGIEISLTEAACYINESPPNLVTARKKVEKALESIRRAKNHPKLEEARYDSVLEAECYLLLARIEIASGTVADAQKHLDDWAMLRCYVSNRYLHHIGEQLQNQVLMTMKRFERKFEEEVYDPQRIE